MTAELIEIQALFDAAKAALVLHLLPEAMYIFKKGTISHNVDGRVEGSLWGVWLLSLLGRGRQGWLCRPGDLPRGPGLLFAGGHCDVREGTSLVSEEPLEVERSRP